MKDHTCPPEESKLQAEFKEFEEDLSETKRLL